jgi:hypothetical protein
MQTKKTTPLRYYPGMKVYTPRTGDQEPARFFTDNHSGCVVFLGNGSQEQEPVAHDSRLLRLYKRMLEEN